MKPLSVILSPLEFSSRESGATSARMAAVLGRAREQGASLVVFPAVTPAGRLPADAPLPAAFLRGGERAVREMVAATGGLAAVFSGAGGPVVAEDGREVAPDADGLYATRHAGRLVVVAGSPSLWDGPAPSLPSAATAADALVVPDATPFARGRLAARFAILSAFARSAGRPLFFANATGVRDCGKVVGVYEGSAYAIDSSGARTADCAPFPEAGAVARVETGDGASFGTTREAPPDGIPEVAAVLREGLRRLLAELGLRRVVIGVSGGIDSAVSTALYGSILQPEDLLLLGMPGPFTSGTTRSLGRSLAANLGARFAEFPIGAAVELTRREFASLAGEGPGDNAAGSFSLSPFAMENVQARDRGSRVLAAAAAAFGGVASCNANKVECTVGYGTTYGDISGWLAGLADLWKGDVYAVGRHLNEAFYGRELIPAGTFAVKPSAELSEKQAVEKGLGDPLVYPYHDKLFRSWVEEGATPAESLDAYLDGSLAASIGYDGDLAALFPSAAEFVADLERWWKLYRGLSVAKRLQAPPVLAVTRRPFGSFPEAQLAPCFPSAYLDRKAQILP